MFPTHKDCRNFNNGICMLLGVPVNPNGPACPRFIAMSSQILKTEVPEASFADLKQRLDEAEAKIREIKTMLKRASRANGV